MYLGFLGFVEATQNGFGCESRLAGNLKPYHAKLRALKDAQSQYLHLRNLLYRNQNNTQALIL